MTFTEAAAEVLRLAGKPLHYKEITELAIEKSLLSHVGKSPEVTMGARLAALLKKDDKAVPIVRVKPGVFALREWSDRKGRGRGKPEASADGDESSDVNALEVEAAAAAPPPPPSSAVAVEDEAAPSCSMTRTMTTSPFSVELLRPRARHRLLQWKARSVREVAVVVVVAAEGAVAVVVAKDVNRV